MFRWQHIEFADGSNPYICTTEKSFKWMNERYVLVPISKNFWKATDRIFYKVVGFPDKNKRATFDKNYKSKAGAMNVIRKAAKSLEIDYPVGTHSTRKTFGFISEQIHPWDINSIQVLMKIFNHSSEQQTKDYIGITKRKMKQYFDDMGETVERIEAGDLDVMIDNSPLISLRHEDLRLILSECCKGDIELYNKALNMVDEKKIKIW